MKVRVRKNLQDALQNSSLTSTRAIHQLNSSNGGYMLATSSGDLCHSTKQAWNTNQMLKKTKSNFVPLQFGKKDELSEIMKRCKSKRKAMNLFEKLWRHQNQLCIGKQAPNQ